MLVLLIIVVGAGRAAADDEKKKPDDASARASCACDAGSGGDEVKGRVIAKATPEEQRMLALRRLGVVVKGGIAIDNAGYDVGVGVRYDIVKRVTLGVDAEYNPWFSVDSGRMVSGATNIYAVGVFHLDVRDYLEVRLTLSAGVSILNFDTWAAKSGSVGPFLALSPVGVAFRMGGHMRFIVDPAEIVVPVPQTNGIPLIYRQHRFTVAVQANF